MARYTFENPTPASFSQRAEFIGKYSEVTEATVNNKTILEGDYLIIRVGALSRVVVTVRGVMSPAEDFIPSYSMPANYGRHILLGNSGTRRKVYRFHYQISPIKSWAGRAPQITVHYDFPQDWNGGFVGFSGHRGQQVIDGEEVADIRGEFSFEPVIMNGGVLLGIGYNIDGAGGTRYRLGYEMAQPNWILYSLVTDLDSHKVTVAAMVKAATPVVLFFLPSLSIGVGPTLLINPEPLLGFRSQASVHWPILGFVASFDVFPSLDADNPRYFQSSLMASFAF